MYVSYRLQYSKDREELSEDYGRATSEILPYIRPKPVPQALHLLSSVTLNLLHPNSKSNLLILLPVPLFWVFSTTFWLILLVFLPLSPPTTAAAAAASTAFTHYYLFYHQLTTTTVDTKNPAWP